MATNNTIETKVTYKYEVAFSFLDQDEAIVTEINDILQDRLKTFLYSKRQGEIAGTDGEKTFNKVFGEESRIVAVFYRAGWGETPWTRIEETAIRNRAYEHGYDFALFIPLDEPPEVPNWLPRTRLWLAIKKYGPEGAASVIESRVQEQGGEPHEETVQERAIRFERELKFKEQYNNFINSFEGVRVANQEFDFLDKELQHLVKEIKNSISIKIKRNVEPLSAEKQMVIFGFGICLNILWKNPFTNTLDNSKLIIQTWDDHPPFPGISNIDAKKIHEINFFFDLTPSGTYLWKQQVSDRKFSTTELASFILKYFMDEIKKIKSHN